ncbi:hypothetical protein Poly21_54380 [Allorhodopirellula heiligendammensis]|uniref:Uncharacterized protein n=1 Tax=Allorhodopirellula heiligendammensis TaxID=2714739 RepID=A0A5C6BF33_9BACT|nr:hypothetical protein Poly21_54380 [Allorhodopirellula heiligendammensis]
MTTTTSKYPKEFLAFRLGRLVVQLPRTIEVAYLIDSCPLSSVCFDSSDRPHVRDEHGSLDRVWADLETTLQQLCANGQDTVKEEAEKTLKALAEVMHQVTDGLQNGEAARLAEYHSEISDISLEYSREQFFESPLSKFLVKFRGEEGQPPKQDEIKSPLRSESWDGLKRCIDALVSRLDELSRFFHIGRSFEQGCEPIRVKESVEFVGKSWNELYRKLASDVDEQISILTGLGLETSGLAWSSAPKLDFEMRLWTTASEIEERLKSFGINEVQPIETEASANPFEADRAELRSSQQKALFDWMVKQRIGGTFNELRRVPGAWSDREEITDDGIDRKLKKIRDNLPTRRWKFVISRRGCEFTWLLRNGEKRK